MDLAQKKIWKQFVTTRFLWMKGDRWEKAEGILLLLGVVKSNGPSKTSNSVCRPRKGIDDPDEWKQQEQKTFCWMALAAGQSVAVNEPSNSTQSDGSSFSFHFLFSFRLIVDLDDEFWAGSIEPSNTKTNFDKERKKKKSRRCWERNGYQSPAASDLSATNHSKKRKTFCFFQEASGVGSSIKDAKQCQRLSFNIAPAIDSNHLVQISRRWWEMIRKSSRASLLIE